MKAHVDGARADQAPLGNNVLKALARLLGTCSNLVAPDIDTAKFIEAGFGIEDEPQW